MLTDQKKSKPSGTPGLPPTQKPHSQHAPRNMTISTFWDDASCPQESAPLWLPTEGAERFTGAGPRHVVLCPAGAAGRRAGDRVVADLGAGTHSMRTYAPALAEEPGVGAAGTAAAATTDEEGGDFNGARNILLRNVVTLRAVNVATPDGALSIEAVCCY